MFDKPLLKPKRVLEPYERISEILFGLIMVLTITCAISASQRGSIEIRTMLFSALGSNLAWGIIDGVFYLMSSLADQSRDLMTLRAVRKAADPQQAQRLIAGALPPLIASIMQPAELETIHQRLSQLPEPPAEAHLRGRDYWGALGVFWLVFLSTLPVVAPFFFMQDTRPALRVSNLIAVMMLFLLGCAYGRSTERPAFVAGIIMVIVGIILVGLTIILGG